MDNNIIANWFGMIMVLVAIGMSSYSAYLNTHKQKWIFISENSNYFKK